MSAKEMFEKLGYKRKRNIIFKLFGHHEEDTITYENEQKREYIFFITTGIHTGYIQKGHKRKDGQILGYGIIEYNELQAINKQVEELGWYD